ncbi:MAG TPA: methionyl-tRNA formyltransferase [Bacillota bacterium]|nr:methionyl-tRNA formyltransferase [Bacillota bacterium]
MKRIVFMGTPDFAVPILEQLLQTKYEIGLVVTQPDRPVGRRRTLTPPPVKITAKKHNIPVFQPEKLSDNFEEIMKYHPDVIITAAYGQFLPKELLELPKYGCINVHASLLPKLRGGAPIHYAILQGEKETGITIMYMEEKLDAGDILTQRAIPIEQEDDVGILHDKLSELGAELLMETLPKLFENSITPIKQNEAEATFAPNITRDIEKIHWSKTSEEVYNHIRGLRPWPVAYTTYENNNIKIWKAQVIDKTFTGEAGEIVDVKDEYFTVVCGDGKGVIITELQPAGSRKMSTGDFLRGSGSNIKKGIVLGEINE